MPKEGTVSDASKTETIRDMTPEQHHLMAQELVNTILDKQENLNEKLILAVTASATLHATMAAAGYLRAQLIATGVMDH